MYIVSLFVCLNHVPFCLSQPIVACISCTCMMSLFLCLPQRKEIDITIVHTAVELVSKPAFEIEVKVRFVLADSQMEIERSRSKDRRSRFFRHLSCARKTRPSSCLLPYGALRPFDRRARVIRLAAGPAFHTCDGSPISASRHRSLRADIFLICTGMIYFMLPDGSRVICVIYHRACFLGWICTVQVLHNIYERQVKI